MDRVIRTTLYAIIILGFAFSSVVVYQTGVEHAYRTTLSSTYSYTCTITTDSPLSNVTLFIPVPADIRGNSPVVERFSTRDITGIPGDWSVSLYDTGKATMVRISTPSIPPGENISEKYPLTFVLSSEMESDRVIDSRDPEQNSALFRPIREVRQVSCPSDSSTVNGTPLCYHYLTSLYADYQASPGTMVEISSSITGNNTWKIFEPRSNTYTSTITLKMAGEIKGWQKVDGFLRNNTGSYDAPDLSE
jgi:hypothetical protein